MRVVGAIHANIEERLINSKIQPRSPASEGAYAVVLTDPALANC
jgi:hypothetical protein